MEGRLEGEEAHLSTGHAGAHGGGAGAAHSGGALGLDSGASSGAEMGEGMHGATGVARREGSDGAEMVRVADGEARGLSSHHPGGCRDVVCDEVWCLWSAIHSSASRSVRVGRRGLDPAGAEIAPKESGDATGARALVRDPVD